MKITQHFSYEEFFASPTAEKQGIKNYPDSRDYSRINCNIVKMAAVLERIRENFGFPIRITSGFRCPTLNKAVGGVSNSYHLYGRAVDLQSNDLPRLKRVLKDLLHDYCLPYGEDYLYKVVDEKTWLHVQFSSAIENYPVSYFFNLRPTYVQ